MTISSALFSERMLARFSDMNEAIQLRQTKISTGQAINEASDAPIDAVRLELGFQPPRQYQRLREQAPQLLFAA